MSRLRFASVIALSSTLGCASTYVPNELPPPRDFSATAPPDMASGSGGNGGGDVDLAASGNDLAIPGASDLATAAPGDLAPACFAAADDGGLTPTLYLAAPAGASLFAARLRGGSWTALPPAGAAVDDVALATVAGRPLLAARLHDATLAAARFDDCRGTFAPLAQIQPAASTAARPAFVGGAGGDLIFRGAVNGDQRYFWSHFDGVSWSAIATEGNFLSTLTPSALRTGGALHAVFAGTDSNLWDGVVQPSGGTATQLTGNTSSLAPAATATSDGKLHVVYTGTNHHLYWFVATAPSLVHDLCDGQPAGCYIVTDAAPTVGLAADGAPLALFHGTDGKLYATRLAAAQWSAPVALTGGDTTSLPPALASGSGSLADVVYVRDGDKLARHVQLTAGGWQPAVTVGATALSGAPALTAVP